MVYVEDREGVNMSTIHDVLERKGTDVLTVTSDTTVLSAKK